MISQCDLTFTRKISPDRILGMGRIILHNMLFDVCHMSTNPVLKRLLAIRKYY